MRALVIVILSSYLFADFSISYLMNNTIKQTVYYKDDSHIMFKIEDKQKILEKLLILNSKKYLSYEDNGIEHIYEISDTLSKDYNSSKSNSTLNLTILRKDENITFNDINATRWIIKNSDNLKESIIVTDNKDIHNAVEKTINALKKILPKDKEQEATIFDMGNGYTLLKSESLELLSFKKEPLDLALFQIKKELSPKEQNQLSQKIDKCFTNVCCGQNSIKANELNRFLNTNIINWKLLSVAKCQYNTEPNIESAIYANRDKFITIELTSKNTLLGKIDSLKSEGFSIEKVKKFKLNGFNAKEAYIPSANATVIDITLPSITISIYTKGDIDITKSAKELLKLQSIVNYSSLNN